MDAFTQFLAGWAREIIVVVGLAAVVEILLPRGDFRRFGRLAMGLFVLLALTKPLFGILQVPVALPPAAVQAQRTATGFVWQETAPEGAAAQASERAPASLASLVETQIAGLAASALGLGQRDVGVTVQLTTKAAGWPGGIDGVRINVLARPTAVLEGCTGDEAAKRLEEAAQALAAQIAAIYRLGPDEVQVIMPR